MPTSAWYARGRAIVTATWSSADRLATSTRWRPWPAGSRSPRWSDLVEPGELDADDIHLPGIYVHRVLALTAEQAADKRIEKLTTRPRIEVSAPSQPPAVERTGSSDSLANRWRHAQHWSCPTATT